MNSWTLFKMTVWLKRTSLFLAFFIYILSVDWAFHDMGYKIGLIVAVPFIGQVVWFFIAWINFSLFNDYTLLLILLGVVALLKSFSLQHAIMRLYDEDFRRQHGLDDIDAESL